MATDPTDATTTCFRAWSKNDPDALRPVLADDVDFVGPLAHVEGADDYVHSITHLFGITTDIVVHKSFVDGNDVLTWFDLHTEGAPPTPVANWSHVEDGRITRVRVTFDPRPLLAASGT